MRSLMIPVLMAVCAIAVPACGDDKGPPPASIRIVSGDIYDDELLLFKDEGALVSLDAKDADGKSLEVSGDVTWSSSAPDVASVTAFGASTVVDGLVDWFDAPAGSLADDAEPGAEITAQYGGLTATVAARVLLAVDGTWTVTVGQDPPLVVPFLQNGRTVSQPLAGMEGELKGATLGMTTSDLTLEGKFSTRDKVEGTGTDAAGVTYQWSAER